MFGDEEQVWPNAKKRRVRERQTHAVYAAMVESMDAAVGKVLKALDEQGLSENTIVCLTSDNGGLSTSEGSPTSNLPLRGIWTSSSLSIKVSSRFSNPVNEFAVLHGLNVLFVLIIPSVVERPRSVAQRLCDNCCIFGAESSYGN